MIFLLSLSLIYGLGFNREKEYEDTRTWEGIERAIKTKMARVKDYYWINGLQNGNFLSSLGIHPFHPFWLRSVQYMAEIAENYFQWLFVIYECGYCSLGVIPISKLASEKLRETSPWHAQRIKIWYPESQEGLLGLPDICEEKIDNGYLYQFNTGWSSGCSSGGTVQSMKDIRNRFDAISESITLKMGGKCKLSSWDSIEMYYYTENSKKHKVEFKWPLSSLYNNGLSCFAPFSYLREDGLILVPPFETNIYKAED